MSFPAKAMAKAHGSAMLRPLSWNRNKRAVINAALSTKYVRQANQPSSSSDSPSHLTTEPFLVLATPIQSLLISTT